MVAVPSSFAAHPHDCEKTCYDSDVMDCEYTFTVETYEISCLNLSNNNIFWLLFRFKSFDPVYCGNCSATLKNCSNPGCITADGFTRTGYMVNRQIPGPTIRVNLSISYLFNLFY